MKRLYLRFVAAGSSFPPESCGVAGLGGPQESRRWAPWVSGSLARGLRLTGVLDVSESSGRGGAGAFFQDLIFA